MHDAAGLGFGSYGCERSVPRLKLQRRTDIEKFIVGDGRTEPNRATEVPAGFISPQSPLKGHRMQPIASDVYVK